MNEERITQAIATFRKAYPDFHSFKNPGPTFSEEELNYKREVSEAFQELGKKLLGGDYDSNPGGFMDDFKGLLTGKLKQSDSAQNLVAWRDNLGFLNLMVQMIRVAKKRYSAFDNLYQQRM